ncbi:MAG: phenylalanine--tRNA ligase subunit beta, partial [Myxococcota bacterium]|nr:phenylalanine--tRNA ligase subunit beta [Myxococcota bacterium]
GGVIGGENSMVVDDTTDLLLEAAHFDPHFIRGTCGRLIAKTESSDRFARGVDPTATLAANRKLAALIVELAGGEILEPAADCRPVALAPRTATLRTARVAGLLGTELAPDRVVELLERDGLRITRGDGLLDALVPPWRFDIEQEVDLIEEVGRLFGYDRIPSKLPVAEHAPTTRSDNLEQDARRALAAMGYDELNLLSFCAEDELRALGWDDAGIAGLIRLENPLGADSALMQPALLPNMLRHAAAASRRTDDLRTFQLRRTFRAGDGATGAAETVSLAALCMGRRGPPGWEQAPAELDFYDLKGVLEGLLARFRVGGLRFDPAGELPPYLDPAQSAALVRGRDTLGHIGRLAPSVIARHGFGRAAFAFEVPFDRLVRKSPKLRYTAPSEYPSSQRDVALLADARISAAELLDEVRMAKPKHLVDSEVFDVYEGDELPAGTRSVAIRMVFQSSAGTLAGATIDGAFERVLERFRARDGVTVRDR